LKINGQVVFRIRLCL